MGELLFYETAFDETAAIALYITIIYALLKFHLLGDSVFLVNELITPRIIAHLAIEFERSSLLMQKLETIDD